MGSAASCGCQGAAPADRPGRGAHFAATISRPLRPHVHPDVDRCGDRGCRWPLRHSAPRFLPL